jgi:integrase
MEGKAEGRSGSEVTMPLKWRCQDGYHNERLHADDWAWISECINGVPRRETLGTQSEREAKRLYREKLNEWMTSAPDPSKIAKKFQRLPINEAIEVYIEARKADVSKGQVQSWHVTARALHSFFKDLRLDQINNANVADYKNHRLETDKVKPKSVNNELATLRLLLKHGDQWYRICGKWKMAKMEREREGRALEVDEQVRLFAAAQSKEKYVWVYVLAILCHYCGMRPCESLHLRWQDIDWQHRSLKIMRSKTPAGWRYPGLNDTCLGALQKLLERAKLLGIAKPEHYIFPYHPRGRWRKSSPPFDPTRPMTKYQRQWDAIRKEAGLEGFRFYDGRHTAFTQMAEAGIEDAVIRAQIGHTSAQVGRKYTHIRRQALNRAAAALEPAHLKNVLLITPEVGDDATIQ